MKLHFKIDGTKIAHTWAGRRARRHIKDFLDGIGLENLTWLIENKRDLISILPPDKVQQTVLQNPVPEDYLKVFPDEEVYGWIPDEYRSFFERLEGGKDWALRQIAFIKNIAITT